MANEMMRALDLLRQAEQEIKAKVNQLDDLRDARTKTSKARDQLQAEVTERQRSLAEAKADLEDQLQAKEFLKIRTKAVDLATKELETEREAVEKEIEVVNVEAQKAVEEAFEKMTSRVEKVPTPAEVKSRLREISERSRLELEAIKAEIRETEVEIAAAKDLERKVRETEETLEEVKAEVKSCEERNESLEQVLGDSRAERSALSAKLDEAIEEERRILAELKKVEAKSRNLSPGNRKVEVSRVPVDENNPRGFHSLTLQSEEGRGHGHGQQTRHQGGHRFVFKPRSK